MMGRRYRVWWPKQLSLRKPSSSSDFLLGWFVSSPPSSLDVVVAFAYTEFALSGLQSSLQGILRDTNGRMPVLLQDKSMLCVVGQIFKDLIEEDQSHSSSCGCHELSGSVEQCRDNFEGNGYWIQMLCDPKEQVGKDIAWIPKLHHVHWNGKIVSRCDVHLILYETPTYGAHHFSLHPWNLFEQVSAPMRNPSGLMNFTKNSNSLIWIQSFWQLIAPLLLKLFLRDAIRPPCELRRLYHGLGFVPGFEGSLLVVAVVVGTLWNRPISPEHPRNPQVPLSSNRNSSEVGFGWKWKREWRDDDWHDKLVQFAGNSMENHKKIWRKRVGWRGSRGT